MFHHIARIPGGKDKGQGHFVFTFPTSLPEEKLFLYWDGNPGWFQVEKITEAQFESYLEMEIQPRCDVTKALTSTVVRKMKEKKKRKEEDERRMRKRRRKRLSSGSLGFGWW
jgi:hypothetical protein